MEPGTIVGTADEATEVTPGLESWLLENIVEPVLSEAGLLPEVVDAAIGAPAKLVPRIVADAAGGVAELAIRIGVVLVELAVDEMVPELDAAAELKLLGLGLTLLEVIATEDRTVSETELMLDIRMPTLELRLLEGIVR